MKQCFDSLVHEVKKVPRLTHDKINSNLFFNKIKNIFMWIGKLWITRSMRGFAVFKNIKIWIFLFSSLIRVGGGACYEKSPQYFVAWFYCMFNPLLYSSLYTYPKPTLFPTHSYKLDKDLYKTPKSSPPPAPPNIFRFFLK